MTLIFLSIFLCVGSTYAEEGNSSPAKGSAQRLMEEMVVTGTRKKTADERIQDVPIAMSAFNGDQLEALQVRNIENLSFSMPNVQLDSVGTVKGAANFSIRGQGINSSIPSVDPTVGVFVDGMYLGVSWGVNFDTFDLESIEVLRGPQGLLFGRNVTAGAVVVTTRQPSHDFSLRTKVGITDDNDQTYGLSMTGSLVPDKLAGKLALYYRNDAGYFENVSTGDNHFGAGETYLARGAVTWSITDAWDTTFSVEVGKDQSDSAPSYTPFDSSRPGFVHERPGDFKIKTHVDSGLGNFGDTDWYNIILNSTLDVAFGDGSITGIVTYRDLEQNGEIDLDGTDIPGFEFHSGANLEQDQTSFELRYSGRFFDDKLDLTVGGYYFEQQQRYYAFRELDFTSLGAAAPTPHFNYGGIVNHETWGVFVNGDISLTEQLTLSLGVRYTYEEKDALVAIALLSTASDLPGGRFTGGCEREGKITCGGDFVDDDDWNSVTPRISMQYYFTDATHAYASFTKGFRSGGYNLRNTSPSQRPGPWDEESQDSYEVGLKSEILDGRVRFGAALFLNEIQDMIREVITEDPDTGGSLQVIQNTADADVWGVEFDVQWLATDNLLIYLNVGHLDDEYQEILADLSLDGVVDETDLNLSLPRLAKWTGSIGGNYDIPVDSGLFTIRLGYSRRTSGFFSDSNVDTLPGISFSSADEKWKFSLYGKNLLNQVLHVTQFSIGKPVASERAAVSAFSPIKKGRVIGAEFTYQL
ncbi:MAG: TonB-dependent receptor [Pseudomonadales bacterium]|nr:TonB-dependent receptor [Pseudomonadales bacterium]